MPEDALAHRATPSSVAARGMAFLSASKDGMPSALYSFDPSFAETVESGAARRLLRQRHGTDIGFDPGDEAFSAMTALAVLPPTVGRAERRFVAEVVRQVEGARRGNRFRFFPSVPAFAADTDCTALAAGALFEHGLISRSQLLATAQDLVKSSARTEDGMPDGPLRKGVFLVYWDDGVEPGVSPRGRKHDAVVCANILATLHLAAGHTDMCLATITYLHSHLMSGDYEKGTRYYPSPAALVHAAARVCRRCEQCASRLASPLAAALRRAEPEGALGLALLAIAADHLGLACPAQWREQLAAQQRQDGSWPASGYFRMGRVPLWFGSPHLTTAFAVRALHGWTP
ncbi:hypothetical protein ACH429_03470 [Streptomyces pathocidini]|uniref:Squalene cyclase C-terminal domain-containing protein n=1 Tax=Streptomyces pathocidini TaxID=1650571 RepID=A0ABW7UKK7_9ACTN|nr:hypothetical protein [Streptomyces pathocidini]